MARSEWFRKRTWQEEDRADFWARLSRSRPSSRAQYLRIQAVHLQQAGLFAEALGLLNSMIEKYPDNSELATAHLQRAQCLAALGREGEAIEAYRSVVRQERAVPNVRTYVWIDFGWFAVTHRRDDLYDEVLEVAKEWTPSILLPVDKYRLNAILAVMLSAIGDRASARGYAAAALEAASESESGLRYHPTLGLVKEVDAEIHRQLQTLAG